MPLVKRPSTLWAEVMGWVGAECSLSIRSRWPPSLDQTRSVLIDQLSSYACIQCMLPDIEWDNRSKERAPCAPYHRPAAMLLGAKRWGGGEWRINKDREVRSWAPLQQNILIWYPRLTSNTNRQLMFTKRNRIKFNCLGSYKNSTKK